METKSTLIGREICTLGGGSGNFMTLGGLVVYPVKLTAICSVFDNGGSTGDLRVSYGALPPGDMRRCFAALAGDGSNELRELLTFRFAANGKKSPLDGQNFGNILMLAAEKLWGRVEAVKVLSSLLNLRGNVAPISFDDAHLFATLSDGSLLEGESEIDTRSPSDMRNIERVYLKPSATISRGAADALMSADVIVFGPGDHYTSLIPNLLVDGFAEAVSLSQAKLVYVANLMTKGAETRGFTLDRFVRDVLDYGVGRDAFDSVIVNSTLPHESLLAKYASEDKAEPVLLTGQSREKLDGVVGSFIEADLLDDAGIAQSLIRHSSNKLASAIMRVK